MHRMDTGRWRHTWLPALALLALLGGGAACDESPEGTLALYWSVNGQPAAAGCPAAGVTRLRVLTGRMGQPPDPDIANPAGAFVDLDCTAGQAELPLPEGLYRIRLVALDAAGAIRSQVVEELGVEVVDGALTSIPHSPDIEPPIDIEVPVCGNGVAESGEWCDATDLAGADCSSLGYDGGTLACGADCTLDETGCTRCGDGVIDAGSGEQCDASELGGATCTSLGLDGGTLGCDDACAFDLSSCLGCGNGVVEGGEGCDDGNRNPGDGCDAACRLEQGALRVSWVPRTSDGTDVSDCATLGVATVQVHLLAAGQAVEVGLAERACTAAPAVLAELPYGLYTVRLSGRDASQSEVAAGQSPVLDLTSPDGLSVTVDLVDVP